MILFEGVTTGTVVESRLAGVDLQIADGDVYAVLSDSPGALATVVDLLLGRRTADTGHVRIGPVNPRVDPVGARRLIGLVSVRGLDPRMSVRRNASAILALCGLRYVGRRKLDEAFRRAEIPERALDVPAGEVRGRDIAAVWLAIARLRETPVLICDQLSTELGATDARHLAKLLRQFADQGHAVLIVDRHSTLARLAAHRSATLRRGRFLLQATETLEPRSPGARGTVPGTPASHLGDRW